MGRMQLPDAMIADQARALCAWWRRGGQARHWFRSKGFSRADRMRIRDSAIRLRAEEEAKVNPAAAARFRELGELLAT
jgi:hypothetical protein